MIYSYNYTKDDYLDAYALEKANARQSSVLIHLIMLLGVGCLVYLNLATLRNVYSTNDELSFTVALAVFGILFVNYSPKLIPALLFNIRMKLNRLPVGLLGWHEFEVADHFLSFRCEGNETCVGYQGLARVNHNNRTVLFYMQNGVIEAVPLRTLGASAAERTKVLQQIEKQAKKENSNKNLIPLQARCTDAESSFSYTLQREDALLCNKFLIPRERIKKLHSPVYILYLLVILLAGAGCVKGIMDWNVYPETVKTFLHCFYIIEAPGVLVALLYWYKPVFLVQYAMKLNFNLGQYPIGYFGEHVVCWEKDSISHTYGVFSLSINWNRIDQYAEDQYFIYLFQNESLLFYIPKEAATDQFKAILQICTKEKQ